MANGFGLRPEMQQQGLGLGMIPPVPEPKPLLLAARREAEQRFPFIEQFRNVAIAPAIVQNKGGMGEFVFPDDPGNPLPGQHTITIGENSPNLQGGIADSVVADMVHAAAQFSPHFRDLKRRLRYSLSPEEINFAQRRYEQDFKGKFTGENFENFENFLNNFWIDGIVQHLLLPENSEIDSIRNANPDANSVLDDIKSLFEQGIGTKPHGK